MAAVYKLFQPQVSLRGVRRLVHLPYWRRRDYLRAAPRRQQRQRGAQDRRQAIQQAALEPPTYGYRRRYDVLQGRGLRIGRERVRRLLAGLGLEHERRPKKRRASPAVTVIAEFPEGRRVQIDATRLSLADGVAWV
jgi:putative transposase